MSGGKPPFLLALCFVSHFLSELGKRNKSQGNEQVRKGGLAPACPQTHTVEISGFSHFFGFERMIRLHGDAVKPYEKGGKRPNCHVGMPFAKSGQGRGLF